MHAWTFTTKGKPNVRMKRNTGFDWCFVKPKTELNNETDLTCPQLIIFATNTMATTCATSIYCCYLCYFYTIATTYAIIATTATTSATTLLLPLLPPPPPPRQQQRRRHIYWANRVQSYFYVAHLYTINRYTRRHASKNSTWAVETKQFQAIYDFTDRPRSRWPAVLTRRAGKPETNRQTDYIEQTRQGREDTLKIDHPSV